MAPEGVTIAGMAPRLLERDAPLGALLIALEEAEAGHGSTALVSGEAGIGKTSLVRAFAARAGARVRLLQAACDDLVTPRTLGPLHDAAAGTDGPLARALASEEQVFGALLDELAQTPTVLIVEDAHWADDATLDVLGYVARRVERAARAARADAARRRDRRRPSAAPAARDAGHRAGAPARALAALARRGAWRWPTAPGATATPCTRSRAATRSSSPRRWRRRRTRCPPRSRTRCWRACGCCPGSAGRRSSGCPC